MSLPIRNGIRVENVTRQDDTYVVTTNQGTLRASNVVVAMANYQVPKTPAFARDLGPDVIQMHSSQYRNPEQLQEGDALVVGMGNSGADIAVEVAGTHRTLASGTETGHVPFRLEGRFGKWIGVRLVRFAAVNVLNTATTIGRKARPKMLGKAAPLVRVKPKDLIAAGVDRVPRIGGVTNGLPTTEDGRVLDVRNVIWCTGFQAGFSWIDLPVFDEGKPRHDRGVVQDHPGLYFVGLFFLHSLWSETLTGMQTDARYVVRHLVDRAGVPETAVVGSGNAPPE
jgi:putative flavoprotein involved in K+ transport